MLSAGRTLRRPRFQPFIYKRYPSLASTPWPPLHSPAAVSGSASGRIHRPTSLVDASQDHATSVGDSVAVAGVDTPVVVTVVGPGLE